jgi:hypothetical protein
MVAVATLGVLATPAHASTYDDEARFLALTNQVRADHGIAGLSIDSQLTGIARRWSANMAAAGTISHNPNLASQVTEYWIKLGENVGMGGSVDAIQQAFVNSPHHYENIVDPAFHHVGIGVVYGSNGTIFVTLDFMELASDNAAPAPPPTAAPQPAPAPAPAPAGSSQPVSVPIRRIVAVPTTATAHTAAPTTAAPVRATPSDPPAAARADTPAPVPAAAGAIDAHSHLALVLDQLRALDAGAA